MILQRDTLLLPEIDEFGRDQRQRDERSERRGPGRLFPTDTEIAVKGGIIGELIGQLQSLGDDGVQVVADAIEEDLNLISGLDAAISFDVRKRNEAGVDLSLGVGSRGLVLVLLELMRREKVTSLSWDTLKAIGFPWGGLALARATGWWSRYGRHLPRWTTGETKDFVPVLAELDGYREIAFGGWGDVRFVETFSPGAKIGHPRKRIRDKAKRIDWRLEWLTQVAQQGRGHQPHLAIVRP